jgi:hypothetical protein
MEFDLNSGEVCLQDNRPIRLRRALGLHITCTAGTVWITVTGQPRDIFLAPGQTYQVSSNGLAIVESIGAGRIRLKRPAVFPGLPRLITEIRRLTGFGGKTGHTAVGRFS